VTYVILHEFVFVLLFLAARVRFLLAFTLRLLCICGLRLVLAKKWLAMNHHLHHLAHKDTRKTPRWQWGENPFCWCLKTANFPQRLRAAIARMSKAKRCVTFGMQIIQQNAKRLGIAYQYFFLLHRNVRLMKPVKYTQIHTHTHTSSLWNIINACVLLLLRLVIKKLLICHVSQSLLF